jgi:ankyrin repeat protein
MRAAAVGGSLIVLLSTLPRAAGAGQEPPAAPAAASGKATTATSSKEVHVTISGGVTHAAADGTTSLHRAVHANDLSEVRHLIHAGASVNTANRYGATPLSLAAANGNAEIVEALLTAGANPAGISGEGEPVLMSAARSGNLATVEMLLAHGADPNARESWQAQTALMWAAAENHADVVQTLLRHGANPNASASTLEYWALVPSESATPKVNTPKGGMAVLHYAARQGALDAVRALASAPGIDLNLTDPDGVSALLYATFNGHYDTAAYLLEHGANPNVADHYGRTLLYAAIDMNRLEQEARPPVRTDDADTPLDLARLALDKGADPNAPITGKIPSRCANGCYAAGVEGATPLWRAARENDVAAVALLLSAGADPRLPARDGSTPLMVAAGQAWRDEHSLGTERESIAAITLLLATGLDVNETNAAGQTALHGAAGRGAAAVVKLLVDNGARLDIKDKLNRTPLDTAMGVGQIVRNGGGAPVDAPVKLDAAKMLRELMAARGVAVEPYSPPPAKKVEKAAVEAP